MINQRTILVPILFFSLVLGGCVSSPKTSEYNEVAEAGIGYATSVGLLTNSAEALAVDAVSVDLIGRSALVGKDNPEGKDIIEAELNKLNIVDVERIQLYNTLRAHTTTLVKYFQLISKIATSDESEKTQAAFTDVTTSLSDFSGALTGAEGFKLDEAAKARIDGVVAIAFDFKQRSVLRKRLATDSKLLLRSLQLHAELFSLFEANIKKDFEKIKDRQLEWLLTAPLREGASLAGNVNKTQKWMDDRREWLAKEASLAQLGEVVKTSNEFKELLTSLINGDQDSLSKLDNFATSLETTKRLLNALSGGN